MTPGPRKKTQYRRHPRAQGDVQHLHEEIHILRELIYQAHDQAGGDLETEELLKILDRVSSAISRLARIIQAQASLDKSAGGPLSANQLFELAVKRLKEKE